MTDMQRGKYTDMLRGMDVGEWKYIPQDDWKTFRHEMVLFALSNGIRLEMESKDGMPTVVRKMDAFDNDRDQWPFKAMHTGDLVVIPERRAKDAQRYVHIYAKLQGKKFKTRTRNDKGLTVTRVY